LPGVTVLLGGCLGVTTFDTGTILVTDSCLGVTTAGIAAGVGATTAGTLGIFIAAVA